MVESFEVWSQVLWVVFCFRFILTFRAQTLKDVKFTPGLFSRFSLPGWALNPVCVPWVGERTGSPDQLLSLLAATFFLASYVLSHFLWINKRFMGERGTKFVSHFLGFSSEIQFLQMLASLGFWYLWTECLISTSFPSLSQWDGWAEMASLPLLEEDISAHAIFWNMF